MEVDAASEDSDATVADEDDVPSAPRVSQFPLLYADHPTNTSQLSVSAIRLTSTAATSQPTHSSRVSDGEDSGPASPSLLHGCTTYKSRLEVREKDR